VVIQPRLKRLGHERQAAARDAIQHVQQGLQGIRDIKVAGREATFAEVFRRARSRLARAEYVRAGLMYLPRVSIESAFLLFIVGVLLLEQLTGLVDGLLATLGLFAYAGMRMQPSLQKIATNLNNLRYGEAVVEELARDFAELGVSPDASRTTKPIAMPEPDPLTFDRELRLDRVTFRYRDDARPVLDRLSMTIRPGASIGIAGQTGCGKSTLLDLICGLLRPTSGTITVDGVDISDDVRAWQRALGVVHQQSFMVDDTIRRNIALGVPDPDIDDDTLDEVVEAAGLAPVVNELPKRLDTALGERGVRLSGGQLQRVALARALYRRPALLLLDEATSALDNATEREVIANIGQFDRGRMAIVAVAHRMQTIVRCDQVVLLSAGRLAGSGTFDQLMSSNPEFAAMSP
jgi:ATP-binding cassette, subfamily B, bacterial PglK